MNDMNRLRIGFYKEGEKFEMGTSWTMQDIMSILLKRQAIIFDAIAVVFDEIQVLKPEPRDLALVDGD